MYTEPTILPENIEEIRAVATAFLRLEHPFYSLVRYLIDAQKRLDELEHPTDLDLDVS